jgi:hypothetical protein
MTSRDPLASPTTAAAAETSSQAIDLATAPDFSIENGLYVFTAAHHLRRGWCCGRGCRHCPYSPPHQEGNTQVR